MLAARSGVVRCDQNVTRVGNIQAKWLGKCSRSMGWLPLQVVELTALSLFAYLQSESLIIRWCRVRLTGGPPVPKRDSEKSESLFFIQGSTEVQRGFSCARGLSCLASCKCSGDKWA